MLQDDTLLGGLYLIRLSDTHFYGGRALCFKTRWEEHLASLQSNRANRWMQNVYNKFGRFEPEILAILPREDHIAAEQAWLDEHFRTPGCVNVSSYAYGGRGGKSVVSHAKMMDPNWGRKNTLEARIRQSEAAKIRVKRYPIRHGESTRSLISSQQAGRIWINNGGTRTRVRSEDLQGYLDQGWVLGRDRHHTQEFKAQASERMIGRVWITNGDKNLFVKPDEVQTYLDQGWTFGRSNLQPTPQEARVKAGAKRHDRIWVTDGSTNQLVYLSEIPEGWRQGLTKKPAVMSDESKTALAAKRGNKRWINNGASSMTVDAEDLQRYLDDGWVAGRCSLRLEGSAAY